MSEPLVVPRVVSWDGTDSLHAHGSKTETPQNAATTYHANIQDKSASISSSFTTEQSAPTDQSFSITSASSNDNLTESSNIKLQDLSHYIAIGCLHVGDLPGTVQLSHQTTEWTELLHTELPETVKTAIGKEASRLLEAHWIRLFLRKLGSNAESCRGVVRVYLLPEDWGRRSIDRSSKSLKGALRQLLQSIDISSKSWYGNPVEEDVCYFDPWANAELSSLYYLFNKLPSPSPAPREIKNRYARVAIYDILESAAVSGWEEHGEQAVPGLRTRLYSYQARSASLMLQREASPQLQLDPRLEVRKSPNGKTFYFGARDGSFLQEPRYYETNRGGILAETMVRRSLHHYFNSSTTILIT